MPRAVYFFGSLPHFRNRINRLLLNSQSFLDVCFENAEDCFVALNRHLQSAEQSLCGKEIHDDPLLDVDRVLGNPNWLWVEAENPRSALQASRNAAEIGVTSNCIFVAHLDLDVLRLLTRSLGSFWCL